MIQISKNSARSVSFDVYCVDPTLQHAPDCFQKSDWTVPDAVEAYCTEYGLEENQVAVEWNEDAEDSDPIEE